MNKVSREWFIDVPWGKIALVSWGAPTGEPVLLVHGRQDSAATFIPMLQYLPEKYYVAIDLPGHGKSDPFPIGVMLTRFHFFASVEYVVKHLGWNKFIYIAHSMGCEQGLFYNVIYPNRITKFIFLDPIPSLQRLQVTDPKEYYKSFYKEYYDNYHKYMTDDRVYSKCKARDAVMKARGLSPEQADLVLSRNLKEVGDDLFKLSWDRRLKYPAPQNYPAEYYYQLFSLNTPPTLVISATNSAGYPKGRQAAEKIITDLKSNSNDFFIESVVGGHDVHLTAPAVVGGVVARFLSGSKKKSKL